MGREWGYQYNPVTPAGIRCRAKLIYMRRKPHDYNRLNIN